MRKTEHGYVYDDDDRDLLYDDAYEVDDYEIGIHRHLTSQEKINKRIESFKTADSLHGFDRAMRELQELSQYKSRYGDKAGESLDPYDEYKKTGIWRGYSYYRPPELSVKYIRQMANLIASEFSIQIRPGHWSVDLEKKILYYDPYSLVYGTKGHVLASILHEAGHVIHTTHAPLIDPKVFGNNQIMQKGGEGSTKFMVLNAYEDFRIDDRMSKSYGESSEEIYEENIPIIAALAASYNKAANEVRSRDRIVAADLVSHLGKEKGLPASKIETVMREVHEHIEKKENFLDFIKLILLEGYGHPVPASTKEMQTLTDLCKPAIPKCVAAQSTKEVYEILCREVYPHLPPEMMKNSMPESLRDLLNQLGANKENVETLDKIMGDNMSGQVVNMNKGSGRGNNKGVSPRNDDAGKSSLSPSRKSGSSDPAERAKLQSGDYKTVLSTVLPQIRELEKKLKLKQTEDTALRYETMKRRGKLNTKSLFMFPSGGRHLFKQRVETTVRTESYCFSLILDTSGSMEGTRIETAMKSVVIMAEVFEKLNIPFEIVLFDNSAKVLKKFSTPLTDELKKNIAWLPRHGGGSTNLYDVFEDTPETQILSQPQKDKMMIIVTDGGIGRHEQTAKAMIPFRKACYTIGVGIEEESDLSSLVDEWKQLQTVQEFPEFISEIISRITKKKK